MERPQTTLWPILLGAAGTISAAWLTAALIAAHLPQHEVYDPEDVAEPGTQYLQINDRSVAYRDRGSGSSAVILLHGFGCDLRTWNSLQPMMTPHLRTVAIDLWGFGASARPADLCPDDWLAQIFGVMDHLQIPTASFIGHSMGGRIALMCAMRAPARVQRLVLLDSDGLQYPASHSLLRMAVQTPTLRLILRRLRRHPRELRRFLQQSYGKEYPINEALLQRYQQPLCVKGTEQCWTHVGRTYPGLPLPKILPQISCPSLLIWGADDLLTPTKFALPLVRSLPHAQLIVIPHCGHLPHELCPEDTFAHISCFLSKTWEP